MKKGNKNQPRNSKGQFVKSAPPPSLLATPAPSSSCDSQPTTPALRSSSLTLSPFASLPSDLSGSYLTSQLTSPALGSSIINIPSHPASPTTRPELCFPTLPVSTVQPPLPTHDSLDSAALSAPTSPSTSTAQATSITSTVTHHTIVPLVPSTAPDIQPTPAITSPQSITTSASVPSTTIGSQPPISITQPISLSTAPIIPTSTTTTALQPNGTMTSLAAGPGAMPAPRSNNAPYFLG